MPKESEDTPRRKRPPKPPPVDAEGERKRLLQKVERLALKKAVKLISSGVESEFDFMAGESRRALEMAEDARAMLDGKPLPVRAELKEGHE